MNDKKRHALITGASRGIGAAIALELAKAGHSISVNYNSHSNDAERVVKDLLNIGVDAKAVKGNVSDKKSVQEMINNATDSLGPVDILVNNAGIISDNLIMRMKDEEFDKVIIQIEKENGKTLAGEEKMKNEEQIIMNESRASSDPLVQEYVDLFDATIEETK